MRGRLERKNTDFMEASEAEKDIWEVDGESLNTILGEFDCCEVTITVEVKV